MNLNMEWPPMMEFPEGHRTWRAGDPRWAVIMKDSRSKSNAWMLSLKQGDIVHYTHGFGAWVRCEVVDHPLCVPHTVPHDSGTPSLVPLAMVGPQWPQDHQCTRDYWTVKISKGEAFQPSASVVYESPYWNRGDEEGDPRTMDEWTA